MPLLRRTHRPRRTHLPTRERIPTLTPAPEEASTLLQAEIRLIGRLTEASNEVYLAALDSPETPDRHGFVVYKPIRGERALWDFPDGTLAGRETAAYLVDQAAGWGLIPETALRDGPAGPGSVQRWIGPLPTEDDHPTTAAEPTPVKVFPEQAFPDRGWHPVLHATLEDGTPLIIGHHDHPRLAAMAVLDAVLNNADRKGSHILTDRQGHIWAVDHGLSLHQEDKLRTILWGWQGKPLPASHQEHLRRLRDSLHDTNPTGLRHTLSTLITTGEIHALTTRVDTLLSQAVYPTPPTHRHPVPWPPL
ncbi:SCO1664 family protein [Austwickia chelonae]|uniref:SCO1664 family protein n=1 Tax=Austwickia chelonae TaxID=100225 RepID=UPI000E25880D|nr:SCO1664 family protein [Austwickia chelonae]